MCSLSKRAIAKMMGKWMLRRAVGVCFLCLVFTPVLPASRETMSILCGQGQEEQDPSACCRSIQRQILETKDDALLETLCSVLTPTNGSELRTPIHMSAMVPHWDRSAWTVGPSIETAILLALWHINHCSDLPVMKKFYLTAMFFDSGCDANRGSKALVDILEMKNVVGVIGPDCSTVALPTAMFSSYLNLSMISYGCEALQLSERATYRTFYRLSASSNLFQVTWRAFFDHFNLTRVATLLELGHEFDAVMTKFQNEFVASGNKLIFSRSFYIRNFNASNVMDDVASQDAIVVLAMVYPRIARQLLCLTHHRKRLTSCCRGRGKQGLIWVFPGWFSPLWFNRTITVPVSDNQTLTCTPAQMTNAASGSFSVISEFFTSQKNSRLKISRSFSLNSSEWLDIYKAVFNKCWRYLQDNSSWSSDQFTEYVSFAYDSTWTWAHAANRALELNPNFKFSGNSNDRGFLNMTIQSLPEFNGVSGRVFFQGADRPGLHSNLRNVDASGNHKVVGYTDTKSKQLVLNTEEIFWGDCCHSDFVPKDRSKLSTTDSNQCSDGLVNAFGTCQTAVAILITLPMVVVVTLIILVVVKGVKKRYKKMYIHHFENRLFELGLSMKKVESVIEVDDEWEIDRKQISINRKLGEGAFGEVFGAEGTDLVKGHTWIPVAVKTLRQGSTIDEKVEFLAEAEVMKRFAHPNIVQLLGLCTKEEPILVVMEMMLHGDMKSYLLSHRHLCSTGLPEELYSTRLTFMVCGVAKGLVYLAQQHFVHRDIAARNCMVTTNWVVKIGDFGMTRDTYKSDYYRILRAAPLPVRWMSPESLLDGIFTHASDMWSFGVVVWETATFGAMPFAALTNQEVLEYIREGHCPDQPKGCTVGLKAFLQWCWTRQPEQRARACDVVEFLSKNTEIIQPCIELSTQPDLFAATNPTQPQYENDMMLRADSQPDLAASFGGDSLFLRRNTGNASQPTKNFVET